MPAAKRAPPSPPPTPAARWARPVAEALDEHAALRSLLARARESQARLAAIGPLLARVARGLEARVRAGPLDETGWTLLADDAAAAAKLRQCLPAIEAALLERAWTQPALKVKVRPR